MARVFSTYVFTAVMLLSQLGLPLQLHYCKGMLESVSVFFSSGCEHHAEPPVTISKKSCCQAEAPTGCEATDNGCCDDELKFISQDITLVLSQIVKWTDVQQIWPTTVLPEISDDQSGEDHHLFLHAGTDSGPPIYILQHALIFYG